MFSHLNDCGRSRQLGSLPANGRMSTYIALAHSGACMRYASIEGCARSVTFESQGIDAFCSLTCPFMINETLGMVPAPAPIETVPVASAAVIRLSILRFRTAT